jgi:hypothetical protein
MRDSSELLELLSDHDGWMLLEEAVERYCASTESAAPVEELAEQAPRVMVVDLGDDTLLVHSALQIEDAVAEYFDREEAKWWEEMEWETRARDRSEER